MKQLCQTSKQNTLQLWYVKLGKELMRVIFQSVIGYDENHTNNFGRKR